MVDKSISVNPFEGVLVKMCGDEWEVSTTDGDTIGLYEELDTAMEEAKAWLKP